MWITKASVDLFPCTARGRTILHVIDYRHRMTATQSRVMKYLIAIGRSGTPDQTDKLDPLQRSETNGALQGHDLPSDADTLGVVGVRTPPKIQLGVSNTLQFWSRLVVSF